MQSVISYTAILHIADISCSLKLQYNEQGLLQQIIYLPRFSGSSDLQEGITLDTNTSAASAHLSQLFIQVRQQFTEYFQGHRRQFKLPLVLQGTPFQLQIWRKLQNIPYGESLSYSDLAKTIGRARAIRAAANAVAANPYPIIIPCHRVRYKNGGREQYAIRSLGTRGSEVKRALLSIEQQYTSRK